MRAVLMALFYGEHAGLARQLLDSWTSRLDDPACPVDEIRLGLSEVPRNSRQDPGTYDTVVAWAERRRQYVRVYDFPTNPGKYPAMRRMLRTPELSFPGKGKLIWCDDDTFMLPDDNAAWWQAWTAAASASDLCGQTWLWPLKRGQLAWLQTQPWFDAGKLHAQINKSVAIKFVQGAFWTASLDTLYAIDWPITELWHNGGDSLLSLRVRCAGGAVTQFDRSVCINCGYAARQSGARRRGLNTRPIGYDYPNTPIQIPDHNFPCTVECFNENKHHAN